MIRLIWLQIGRVGSGLGLIGGYDQADVVAGRWERLSSEAGGGGRS